MANYLRLQVQKVGLSFGLSVTDSKTVTTASRNDIFAQVSVCEKETTHCGELSHLSWVKKKDRNSENKELVILKLQY